VYALQLFRLYLPAPCTHAAGFQAGFQAALCLPAQALNDIQPASAAALDQLWTTADHTTAADSIASFEATVAPHIAAEALSEVSLEDLRLQAHALRPVGCWSMGCAPVRHAGAWNVATTCGYDQSPDRQARWARAGAATCPA